MFLTKPFVYETDAFSV